LIDSGNGLQGLWRMSTRIELDKPVKGKFSQADQNKIADIEARVATIMIKLGAKPGTQNIDRILRLPGTTNLPNAAKRKAGRGTCQSKLLWLNGASYELEDFPESAQHETETTANCFEQVGIDQPSPVIDESGSGFGYRFMRKCHAQSMNYDEAREAILADEAEAGEWAN